MLMKLEKKCQKIFNHKKKLKDKIKNIYKNSQINRLTLKPLNLTPCLA